MITQYTTSLGVHLELGRIPRHVIDEFVTVNRAPSPPRRPPQVEVLGGVDPEDWLDDINDPAYMAAVRRYNYKLFDAQFDLIADAINIEFDASALEPFYMMGLERNKPKSDYLRYVVLQSIEDASGVSSAIIYNSTVTQRGIDEAMGRFDVQWLGLPVSEWYIESAPASFSFIFESRLTARRAHISWADFCELTGPQQSEEVALTRLENKLQWLMNN